MQVNLIAWALNQALPHEQRAILSLMALLAGEAGTGALYLGNLVALSTCALLPLPIVRRAVDGLQALGLIVPFNHGYQLQAGVLIA